MAGETIVNGKADMTELAKYLYDLGMRAQGGINIKGMKPESGVPIVFLPEGIKPVSLAEFVPSQPDRKRADIKFQDIGSFVEYVNEQKELRTRIFAKLASDSAEFQAIIDFQGNLLTESSWMTHHARLILTPSQQWEAWKNNNKKVLNQEEFADFLKERRLDVVKPNGATLLEIITTLEATSGAKCVSAIPTNKGRHIEFKEDVIARAGKDGYLDVPETLKLNIPIFEGMEAQEIEVDFILRVGSGNVTLGYRMLLVEEMLSQALMAVRNTIRDATSLPVYIGSVS
jgi:uncharacterized protein YfdQ (DUF2303 family)